MAVGGRRAHDEEGDGRLHPLPSTPSFLIRDKSSFRAHRHSRKQRWTTGTKTHGRAWGGRGAVAQELRRARHASQELTSPPLVSAAAVCVSEVVLQQVRICAFSVCERVVLFRVRIPLGGKGDCRQA